MPESLLPSLVHMQSLQLIREHELDIALKYFPPTSSSHPCRLLELGAGTGQQAKFLTELGYCVSAIDLPSSSYKDARIFPIANYDGEKIPFDSEQFDVVFSSNVLEHVISIDKVLAETYRILVPGGLAVHIIPSPACRIWSIPAHYVWLARRILAKLTAAANPQKTADVPRTPQSGKEWIGTFFPLRHGERGNTLTEVYYFSPIYWRKKFQAQGFGVNKIFGSRIFYTMTNAMGSALPLRSRKSLSHILGSSCFIYVITKD